MERGSVVDAEQTRLEFTPDVTLAVMDNGMVMEYWDYMQTHEWQERNRRIQNAIINLTRIRRSPLFLVPYHRYISW